jgi:thiol-disulfide isomerase/thioredoxin
MILELNEENFKKHIAEQEKILVFFYRESGCSYCDKAKPLVAEYAKDNVVGYYRLDPVNPKTGKSELKPDSITSGLVDKFPTFVAYENGLAVGKRAGATTLEQLAGTFNLGSDTSKDKDVAQPGPLTIEKATLSQLVAEEYFLIDKIGPLKENLKAVRNEIKRRKQLAGILKKKA